MTAATFFDGKPEIPIPPSVLRGPADADHYRVKVGRYGDRWYTDPLPACAIAPASGDASWPSVSTIKKAAGSDWSFVALKRVAEELRIKPDALTGLDFDACYDRLKSINKLGLNRAAARGTNVHTYFEKGLRGQSIDFVQRPDEPGAEYLPAVRRFFDAEQPELIAAEVVTINRTLNGVGYGGTGDAAMMLKIQGCTAWADYKSRGADSDHGAYAEESAQIAGYTTADYMIVEGEQGPERRLLPVFDCGVIISVKPDGYRIYPVDLKQAADHWQQLHAWWVARRTEKASIGKPWAPRGSKSPASNDALAAAAEASDTESDLLRSLISLAHDNAELEVLWRQHKDLWTEVHTRAAADRKKELAA